MEQVSNLIAQKLETMAEAGDRRLLQSKRKAITTLLPHAVWQEREGRPETLDAILHAFRATRVLRFTWNCVDTFFSMLFSKASPRAAALASPHIHWDLLIGRGDLIERWVATVSTAPHIDEVVQSVIDALLQIASAGNLATYIPVDLWSWLTECPPLPIICWGRSVGTCAYVVDAVRALEDVEVFKSYLLLVWSEWGFPWSDGIDRMRTYIQDDFGGIGMGHHRADLIQRLDHVLGQLDLGLWRLGQHDPELGEVDLEVRTNQYRELRELLLEVNIKAISRKPRSSIIRYCTLT